MKVRTSVVGVVLALVAFGALIISSAGSAKSEQDDFTMAIVTDIGKLQDRSFNQLANKGRLKVGKELGIQTRVYVTKTEAQRIPNMLAAGRAGYDLIFAVGFLNYTAVNAVATAVPEPAVRRCRPAVRALREQAEERAPASSSPSTRPATSSAISPRCSSRVRAARRSSAQSAPTTCRRS